MTSEEVLSEAERLAEQYLFNMWGVGYRPSEERFLTASQAVLALTELYKVLREREHRIVMYGSASAI